MLDCEVLGIILLFIFQSFLCGVSLGSLYVEPDSGQWLATTVFVFLNTGFCGWMTTRIVKKKLKESWEDC